MRSRMVLTGNSESLNSFGFNGKETFIMSIEEINNDSISLLSILLIFKTI